MIGNHPDYIPIRLLHEFSPQDVLRKHSRIITVHRSLILDCDALLDVSQIRCTDEVAVPVSDGVTDDRFRKPGAGNQKPQSRLHRRIGARPDLFEGDPNPNDPPSVKTGRGSSQRVQRGRRALTSHQRVSGNNQFFDGQFIGKLREQPIRVGDRNLTDVSDRS